jgi:DNA replication protein DnaC
MGSNMNESTQNKRLTWIKSCGGDEHFLTKTWQNFQVDTSNERAIKIVQALQLGQTPGAYIRGPVGCGKTHIMKAILNYIIDWKIQLELQNQHAPLRPFWINMSLYLDELRHDNVEIKKRAQTATVLFIDDIGTSTKTDWVTDQVFQLIDYRAERDLQTFITSNYKIADLEPFYGERVISRLFSMCVAVEMVGKDHRIKQMKNNFSNITNIMNTRKEDK